MKIPKTVINSNLIDEGITPSELATFDSCAEKWYLSYNHLLQLDEINWASVYGSAIHASLEEFYKTKGKSITWNLNPPKLKLQSLQFEQDLEYWDHVGLAQVRAYTSRYKNDFKIWKIKQLEYKFDFTYENLRWKGMADMIVEDEHGDWFIFDTKTSGRLDASVADMYEIRFQFMYYVWAATKTWPERRIAGYIPSIIKKPQLKQGSNESAAAFGERVRCDMIARPEAYFYRNVFPTSPESIRNFELNVLNPKAARMLLLRNPDIDRRTLTALARNKNTDTCCKYGSNYKCHFLDICRNTSDGFNLQEMQLGAFRRRENKHVELAEND